MSNHMPLYIPNYLKESIDYNYPPIQKQKILPSERFKFFQPNSDEYIGYMFYIGIDEEYTHVQSFKDLVSLFIINNVFFDFYKYGVHNLYGNTHMVGFEIKENISERITLPNSIIHDLPTILDRLYYDIQFDARWFEVSVVKPGVEVISW